MQIQMFNFWYFFWLILCVGAFLGLYFLLRKRTQNTKKIVLFFILLFALALHFLKVLFPPYSTNESRLLSDIWFINICGANIFLFPFIFLSKNKTAKDYMFFIGVLSGFISMFLPLEPLNKVNQAAEWMDVIRYYIHHTILWIVPLLMVIFKLHTISWRRFYKIPGCLLLVMLFIMINQILQSELGFIDLRGDDIFAIGYKNSSYIWGPDDDIGYFIAKFCPDIFKNIPVGEYMGQEKYWPWVWLIVPAYLILTPIIFILAILMDAKGFARDVKYLFKHKNQSEKNT